MNLKRVKDTYKDELLAKQHVVAVGMGFKKIGKHTSLEPCIVVSVDKKLDPNEIAPDDLIPKALGLDNDSVETDVVETGIIRALEHTNLATDRTSYLRPAMCGMSIGHSKLVTAGTLGCLVKRDDTIVMLSNNHVFVGDGGKVGDEISQPGRYDVNNNIEPKHIIGTLFDFVPIRFRDDNGDVPCGIANTYRNVGNRIAKLVNSRYEVSIKPREIENNLVDAAIAVPFDPYGNYVTDHILETGVISGLVDAYLGMNIQKSGRTTGLTKGTITQVDVTVDVSYGGSKTARFEDQLMAGAMSQGGDSGSAVLDSDNNLTGLLFAGSDQTTVINRIQNVFRLLRLELL